MSINIQEILYPNDSDSVKWGKVNYNFDQILASGGKEGPKGERGASGLTGAVGLKGEKGDEGAPGSKGETGTSTNFWDQFQTTLQGADAWILKPKNEVVGGNNRSDQTAVVIGDSSYNFGSSNGILDSPAQLTVFTDSAFSYAQKWGPSTGNDFLTIRGEVNGFDTTRTDWKIQPEGMATNSSIILSSENVELTGGSILFSGTGTFIGGGGETRVTNDGVDIVSGYLKVGGVSTFSDTVSVNSTKFLKIPVGTTVQRAGTEFTSSNGMIRYNSTINKFEGYVNGVWRDFQRLSDSTRFTHVSVESDNRYAESEDSKINLVAGQNKMISVSSTQVEIKGSTGNDIIKTTNTQIDLYEDIVLDSGHDMYIEGSTNGIIYPAGALKSAGTPAFGTTFFSSPSYNSAEGLRNLNDYFYQASYFPEAANLSPQNAPVRTVHEGTYFIGLWGSASGIVRWQMPYDFDSGDAYYQKSSESKVTWTKIGNQVMVNGHYKMTDWGGDNNDWRQNTVTGYDNVLLGLGEITGTATSGGVTGTKSQFPFINQTDQPILVNVKIYGVSYDDGANSNKYLSNCFGLILPGERYIKLYYTTDANGIDDSYIEAVRGLYLQRISNTFDTTVFLFNFTMPTDINTGTNSYSTGGGGVQQGGGLQL